MSKNGLVDLYIVVTIFFFYMPGCFNVLGRGEERFGWGGSRRAGAWDANKAGGTVECRV